MTKPLRAPVPGFPHHVIVRGNNRRRLFSYATDFERFLYDVSRALERSQCRLHAMVLMSNHVHMIVTPPAAPCLPRFVKTFAQRYAQFRNKRRSASGKLFEERYKMIPVLNDAQLAVTTVYADVNAARAGVVEDPMDYRWSTYPIHAGRPDRSSIPLGMWTASDWYVDLGDTAAGRAKRYLELADEQWRGGASAEGTQGTDPIDGLSAGTYARRVERPDRTRACESRAMYGNSIKRAFWKKYIDILNG